MKRLIITGIISTVSFIVLSQKIYPFIPYLKANGKYVFVNKSVKQVFPGEYDNAWTFHEDYAVVNINNKTGCINTAGKLVIPAIYDATGLHFSEGLLRVKMSNKWGYIDKTGKLIMPFIYDKAFDYKSGLALVGLNEKFGFIDKAGQAIIPLIYESCWMPKEGMISVKQNGKWGYLDLKGTILIPFEFEEANPFDEGMAVVKKDGKWGFIDKSGKWVLQNIYEDVDKFSGGLAPVKQSGKWGFMNSKGDIIVTPVYEEAYGFSENLATVKLNGKYGFVNTRGLIVIPPNYESTVEFGNGLSRVSLTEGGNKIQFYIDKSGIEYRDKNGAPSVIAVKPVQEKVKSTNTTGIKVGDQVWMTRNLDVDRFRNGDRIPEAKTNEEWLGAALKKKPVWCYYQNNPVHGKTYGRIYNWYAVTDPRGLAPEGCHIPGLEEWEKLINYLGGKEVAGKKMKSTKGWKSSYSATATNESGFNALPGGYRMGDGKFNFLGQGSDWWSSSEYSPESAIFFQLDYGLDLAYVNILYKENGCYVRCLVDDIQKVVPAADTRKDPGEVMVPYLKSNGAYVYTDLNLKPVINTEYEKAGLFDEKGMAIIMKNGKYGYIDNKGKEIILPQYELLYGFVEDLAWYKMADGNCGFLDRTGNRKIQLHSDYPTYFREGLAAVCKGNLSSDRWGYINKTGNLVIPYQFASANPFYEGLACVSIVTKVNKDGYDETKYGFINNLGNIVIPAKYDHALPFSEGLAGVGIYKEITNEALDKDNMEDFLNDYDWKYIDKNGNDVIPPNYSIGGSFKNGVAPVKQNNKWGFINKQGQVVLPFMYKEANWSEQGAFCVKQGNVWGVINNNGQWVITPKYGWIYEFWNGFADVRMFDTDGNEVFFYIDKRGNEYRDKEIVLTGEEKEKKTYQSVQIGDQVWMSEDLDVDHFRNGDPILEAVTEKEWNEAGIWQRKPAWCYNKDYVKIIMHAGKLYNGYTVQDPRGLAPEGWHIASDSEWAKLISYLGGPNESTAKKLKATWSWDKYNTSYNGNNESGFSAVSGGSRAHDIFMDGGSWWTSTPSFDYPTGMGGISYQIDKFDKISREGWGYDRGKSVRCVKDASVPNNKNNPPLKRESNTEVTIGTQTWAVKNLDVDHFRNGDLIPEAKTAEEWIKAGNEGKPAWCYMDNNPANGEKYGKLYNWFAVNDPRSLAPKEWHVPSEKEEQDLVFFIKGNDLYDEEVGFKMKSTIGWLENGNGSNSSGFNALPGGCRFSENGSFSPAGKNAYYWLSDNKDEKNAYFIRLVNNLKFVAGGPLGEKGTGMSVRCIKD